ncbi:uncharacterized protein LOC129566512 [Sitodiplosis mosellana]|uniref:uncharacterized protein LOC129566512 n=1 Tax=Sitodiplosis mosellana TaxID=263140 RepID=UPI00244451CD|nr:uncharacterized protein LOC129566512 [Sitodiplosis mosellana]
MVKTVDTPKKRKGVRTKSLKKVKNTPSLTSFGDMNDDCLTSVFDYLDTASLVKMTKTCQRMKDIVTDRVIPRKIVQFGEIRRQSSTRKAFELFGPSMTRMKIHADDIQMTRPGFTRFSEFLRLLMAYGEPGKLQQLSISGFIEDGREISSQLLEAARPYLENVHTLRIELPANSYMAGTFSNKLMTHMPKQNLRHLCLHNIRLIGEWLSVESMPKLEVFHLSVGRSYYPSYANKTIEQLRTYIAEKPQLTCFNYVGPSQESILVEVSRHIPNIARICTVKNLMVDGQSNGQNDDNNSTSSAAWGRQGYRAKWKHLTEFTNLKQFSLESHAPDFKNCGEVFRILANRNTVEHLELITGHICQDGNNPVDIDHLRQMTNVKTLRLVDFGRFHGDEFMGQLFENLIGLHECTIDGSQLKQAPIINLVETGRNLRVLNMATLTSKYYRKLVKVRKVNHPELLGQPLVVRVPKQIADNCTSELNSRTYKPDIIMIQPIQ